MSLEIAVVVGNVEPDHTDVRDVERDRHRPDGHQKRQRQTERQIPHTSRPPAPRRTRLLLDAAERRPWNKGEVVQVSVAQSEE
jgi:hypothetical protein